VTGRFRWQRDGRGGFVAWPEGEALPRRRAELVPNGTSQYRWTWRALYDDAAWAGDCVERQEAADAANAAWPGVKRDAAERAARAAEDEALRTLVRRMCAKGDLTLEVFGVEASDSARLTRILWLIRQEGGIGGPATPLVEACSAELFRRRTGSSSISE
jgi:hypothetical protein